MNAIVSVTQDWGIGHEGSLLVRNPADMRFFRQTTMGGTVLCGRKTFESFPGGALKGRRNIVISRDAKYGPSGAEVAHSPQEALELVAGEDPERVWLIGGASIYEQFLPSCTRALVTRHKIVVEADAYFPNLDESDQWELVSTSAWDTTPSGVPFAFAEYVHV
ncbi:MAG: dihydrofolate reductase [Coriobacteriales bacterium]|nr:dihydrofolate reductase [Coriobacteriales bacterium]